MSKKPKKLKWEKIDIGYEAKALGRYNLYIFTVYFYDCWDLNVSIACPLSPDTKEGLENYELRSMREAKIKAQVIADILELV